MSAFPDARCEDESGNSAVLLGRVGKHTGTDGKMEERAKKKREREIYRLTGGTLSPRCNETNDWDSSQMM